MIMPKEDGTWKKMPFGLRTEHLSSAGITGGGENKSQIRGPKSIGEIRGFFGEFFVFLLKA